MRKYRIPVLIIVFSFIIYLLCGAFFPVQTFTDFTRDIFRHEISSNTLNLHYTLTDPSSYDLEPRLPTFGNLDHASVEAQYEYLETCLKKTEHYITKGHLNTTDLFTARLLKWWLEGQLKLKDYYYYQEPLGPTLGIQAQLPVLLAEFPFRCEEDIHTYLELLTTLPDYFGQLGTFEKEKSQQGLFMTDECLDQVLTQCQALFPVNTDHILVTSFAERLQECSFLTADQCIPYEAQNYRILTHYVQPAYDDLCQTLETLRGTGTNPYGLYHTPDGLNYYEYLLKYSIGTDLSLADIHRVLEIQMESDYETILHGLHQGLHTTKMDTSTTFTETPKSILQNLQTQIQNDFPPADRISWEIKEVPKSLQEYLSPAFYMTPAIDAREINHIYINPAFQPDRNELITTLAHEGYPGHLYQNSFENTANYDPVRNLIYIGGYTEGWGLYSEFYAYDYLDLSKEEADFLRALSSLNYAICANLDLSIHGQGWTEEDCTAYLSSFGITDSEHIHELYLNILEEPANYLKYYLGYLEICALKESILEHSPELTIYDFHKWFLETGPAPFFLLNEHCHSVVAESPYKLYNYNNYTEKEGGISHENRGASYSKFQIHP